MGVHARLSSGGVIEPVFRVRSPQEELAGRLASDSANRPRVEGLQPISGRRFDNWNCPRPEGVLGANTPGGPFEGFVRRIEDRNLRDSSLRTSREASAPEPLGGLRLVTRSAPHCARRSHAASRFRSSFPDG